MCNTVLKTNLLDKAISIAIMLFILSMIAERFVTWMKLYFGKPGRSLPGFSQGNEDMRRKPATREEEKRIEVKVTGLNIVLSILIAIAANANLFRIMDAETPFQGMGWDDVHPEFSAQGFLNLFLLLLGCTLTGLFISLGSKFWHDLLDLLLYTKNLKQKLSEPQTYEATSADQLTEYLQFTEADLVRLAISQHEAALRAKFENIEFMNDSIAVINGERRDVLGIFLVDHNEEGLPAKVPVILPSGKIYQVTTDIVAGVGSAHATGALTGKVANKELLGYAGSGCCLLSDETDGKTYLLTNCHVMTDGYRQNPLFNTSNPKVLYDKDVIGEWQFGTMSPSGDFALAEIRDVEAFISKHGIERFTKTPKALTKDDWQRTRVTARGNICEVNEDAWIIEVVRNQVRIMYNNGEYVLYNSVILVGDQPDKKKCRPVSDKGDSGGAVYDKDLNLVGIITGRGTNYSYVLPIDEFIRNRKLKIFQA